MIWNTQHDIDLTNGRDVDLVAVTISINGKFLKTIYLDFRTDRKIDIIDCKTDGVNSK